ncbi:YgaP family membrane protein [Halobacterium jilantaiense]|uniref:Inner membrane protein YgaP-like transmembrane domain-containing protein n=1 Tax=Halobacterium jilantaiense TaxID=355548 RepID=A0A1I0QSC4_9EURY|nr:DUF2892 domain-containing protein [Halobacterium jilantaiense]SEW30276.1 Protein of unknown function [Halobacterium jilantaiense]
MKNNVGAADRQTRLVVGVLLLVAGLASLGGLLGLGTTVGAGLSLVGVVLIATGLVRVCLVYRVLGVDTSDTR